MIKGLIDDLKLGAMQAMNEVKDVVHDATTKLPDEGIVNFNNESQQQSIPQADLNYMSNGWNVMPAQMTANRIDMIAEKINFVSDMIQQGLLAFDGVEVELRGIASGNVPPTPAQLIGIAGRIDANQKQVYMGLQKLKELSVEIDRATDKLQGGNSTNASGWGSKGIGGTGSGGWY